MCRIFVLCLSYSCGTIRGSVGSFTLRCRCCERQRSKAGGWQSLTHTRWIGGRGYLRRGKWSGFVDQTDRVVFSLFIKTLVLIVLRPKNATPKRFFREHRGTHSKYDAQTKTDRERHRDRKETQHTHTLRPCWWEGVWSEKRALQGEERGV